MKTHRLLLAVAILGIGVGSLLADDSVVIESRNVPRSASDVLVHVKITNSDTISIVLLPLEFREITQGSFVTSLEVSFQERFTSALQDYRFANLYSVTNGLCGETGAPAYGAPDASALDTIVAVTASPSGLICAAIRYAHVNNLAPGTDSAGSIALRIGVTDTPGSFEIDTTCISPNHHLMYFRPSPTDPHAIIPTFTKGIITITDCDCSYHGDLDGDAQITSLDLGLLIDYLFASGEAPPADPSCPHIDRGDVDCSGFDDALDVGSIVDYLFAGGPPPCNPCDCDPYPASCP